MPRAISPYIANAISQYGTRPVWMIEITPHSPYGAMRHTNLSHVITWGGFNWDPMGIKLGPINESSVDASTRVFYPNASNLIGNFLAMDGIEQPVEIYRTWADAPDKVAYGPDEMMHVLSGIIAGAPSLGLVAELEIVKRNAMRKVPFLRIDKPTNNFNWPAGTPISFNRKVLQVIE